MKKNFLTAMLFFAFLFVGINNSSAQTASDGLVVSTQYVNSSAASAILSNEITALEEHPVIYNDLQAHPEFPTLNRKLHFYVAVYEGIVVGNTVPESILAGEVEANDIQDDSAESFDPYLLEVVQLLSQ